MTLPDRNNGQASLDAESRSSLDAGRHVLMKLNIPFCVQKCPFCTRDIIAGWNSQRTHAYMLALQRELLANAGQFLDCIVDAIRLGGGIASNASGQDVSDTLRIIRQNYRLIEDAPVSMRSSVANISGASMPLFKRAGINRFDFEQFSLEPIAFSRLNKTENFNDFPVVCDYFLRSYTNDNLGVVLLFGSSDVDMISLRRSLLALVRGNAVHLILQRCEGKSALSEDLSETQLIEARDLLQEHGFMEYAPQHFARLGNEDPFFIGIAGNQEVLSFGLGASSLFEDVMSVNTTDLETYLKHSDDFTKITERVLLV